MRRLHTFLVPLVTASCGLIVVMACQSEPSTPEPTNAPSEAPSQTTHAKKKKLVELHPVGLGGGPQDDQAASSSNAPPPAAKPKTTAATKASGKQKSAPTPTFTLPPWPSAPPPSWWPFPSTSETLPPPPAPGVDAGPDWATGL